MHSTRKNAARRCIFLFPHFHLFENKDVAKGQLSWLIASTYKTMKRGQWDEYGHWIFMKRAILYVLISIINPKCHEALETIYYYENKQFGTVLMQFRKHCNRKRFCILPCSVFLLFVQKNETHTVLHCLGEIPFSSSALDPTSTLPGCNKIISFSPSWYCFLLIQSFLVDFMIQCVDAFTIQIRQCVHCMQETK